MNLMWDIVVAPGEPRTIVEAGAKHLAEVADVYREHSNHFNPLLQLVERSMEELRAHRNHVAALRTLVQTVDCYISAYTKVSGWQGVACGRESW